MGLLAGLFGNFFLFNLFRRLHTGVAFGAQVVETLLAFRTFFFFNCENPTIKKQNKKLRESCNSLHCNYFN